MDTLLTRRVEKILPDPTGLQKELGKRKLRLYIGADPTGNLHIGHSLGFRKLMEFAEAGHEAILLFGTGTVLVGDPSLRDNARKLITQAEIDANISTWKEQVSSIVDFGKIKVKKNGDWLTKLTLKDFVSIGSHISAVQLFKRESFARRLAYGDTVWYHETMYPLLQGYDSVAMDVDLEIGGTDQEFNMLMGRELQKKINNKEKWVLTTPLLMGTDGQKMSKSVGNCIWMTDTPEDMYGKTMTVRDELLNQYFDLLTNLGLEELKEVEYRLKSGANPRKIKARLAKEIVTIYHSPKAADSAQEAFNRTFRDNKLPEEITQVTVEGSHWQTVDLLLKADLAESKSQARRLLEQGSIRLNQEKTNAPSLNVKTGDVLQVGKRSFRKLKVQ